MVIRKYKWYERELQNLQRAEIKNGFWIDAGCGQGAYTIPLALLVDKVLAIDRDSSNLDRLEKKINEMNIQNITIENADFTRNMLKQAKEIDGILFAFSLHYQKNLVFLEEILKEKEEKMDFKIVILEYERTIPVPWVPHPYPIGKIRELVKRNGIFNLEIIFQNNRYYIGKLTQIN